MVMIRLLIPVATLETLLRVLVLLLLLLPLLILVLRWMDKILHHLRLHTSNE